MVTDGLDVVNKIAETDTDWNDAPLDPQVIRTITVDTFGVDYPEPESIVAANVHGAKIQEIPVVMKERIKGVSSINWSKSIYYMIKVSIAIILCKMIGEESR